MKKNILYIIVIAFITIIITKNITAIYTTKIIEKYTSEKVKVKNIKGNIFTKIRIKNLNYKYKKNEIFIENITIDVKNIKKKIIIVNNIKYKNYDLKKIIKIKKIIAEIKNKEKFKILKIKKIRTKIRTKIKKHELNSKFNLIIKKNKIYIEENTTTTNKNIIKIKRNSKKKINILKLLIKANPIFIKYWKIKKEKKYIRESFSFIKNIKYKNTINIKNISVLNKHKSIIKNNIHIWKINSKNIQINDVVINNTISKKFHISNLISGTKNIKTTLNIKKITSNQKIISYIKYYKYKLYKLAKIQSFNKYMQINQIKLRDKNTNSIIFVKINSKYNKKFKVFGNTYIYIKIKTPEINFKNKKIHIRVKTHGLILNTKNIIK